MGGEVTALSSSSAKEEDARRFGAHHFVTTGKRGALKSLARTQGRVRPMAEADAALAEVREGGARYRTVLATRGHPAIALGRAADSR